MSKYTGVLPLDRRPYRTPTAEPDLLPLPEWTKRDDLGGMVPSEVRVEIHAYARACIDHATAAKADEIEALRAQVERLTSEVRSLRQQYDERTVYMVVHRGAALACSDSMRAAYSDEHRRAERLAEALREELRWWADRKADAIREQVGGLTRGDPEAIARCDAAIQRINAALRDKED